MHHANKNIITTSSLRLTLLVLALVSSQLNAAYELRKYTINNGGIKISNSRFVLNISMAQVDANTNMTATRFQLSTGFWQQNTDLIFTNRFE